MSNILLGATGSVAAVRVPALVAELTAAGHAVRVVATDAATYFFDPAPLRDILTLDADEWPGERFARNDPVRHIELRNWADVFVIAPLDANTLAKLAAGLCDNCLTCVWRAWDPGKPVVLAPAMNTLMWEHPFTRKHLRAVAADFGATDVPGDLDGEELVNRINERATGLRIVGPISKRLACGDVGVGAMAEVPEVVEAVTRMF
ncbi:MAG TPA: flavoprotein [Fimbriiglobus sp.]|nr:flavoprotein [Fimbriiglobus sp.]